MFVTDKLRGDVAPVLDILIREAEFLQSGLQALDEPDGLKLQPFVLRALERSLQIVIEGVADTGNALIDALLMRDPSSYADIVAVLSDEDVLDPALATTLTEIIMLRKVLVLDYLAKHDVVTVQAARRHQAVIDFVEAVRRYLAD